MSSPLIRDEIHVLREIQVLKGIPPTSTPEKHATPAVSDSSGTDGEDKWEWWQGYRKDRKVLGFLGAPAKSVTLMKKPQKRKKKDDD
jgi:hypothetical protein